ncbi:hypothetical protein A2U01_0033697, partial [Trifolium medium]|nr:hypothetical protein [Trifolium medium]
RDEEHYQIVQDTWKNQHTNITSRLDHTLVNLHNWGKQKFGEIPKRIKQTQADLQALNDQTRNGDSMQNIRTKEKELDNLLQCEEMWWSQRSRAMWLKHGDKNTSYFHQKASQRRRSNKIEHICDNQGTNHYEPTKIEEIILTHFQKLFETQETHHIHRTVEVVKNSISQDHYNHLNDVFTESEVTEAIKNMKGLAAPGPDGLPALFYHTYWDIIRQEVITAVLNVLNHKGDTTPYNHTYICLIPKKKNPS